MVFFLDSLFQDGGFLFLDGLIDDFLGDFYLCSCSLVAELMCQDSHLFSTTCSRFSVTLVASRYATGRRVVLRRLFHRMSLLFNCCCFFGVLCGDRKAQVNLESFHGVVILVRRQQERPDDPCLRDHCNTCCC